MSTPEPYIPTPSHTVGWDYKLKTYHTKCLLDLTAAQLTGAEYPDDPDDSAYLDSCQSEAVRGIEQALREVLSLEVAVGSKATSWLMLPNPLEREDLPDDEPTLCARCGRKV